MDKKILTEIPFTIDLEVLKEKLKIRKESMIETAEEFIDMANTKAKPKAIYMSKSIDENNGEYIQIDGVNFYSKVLAEKTKNTKMIFPYVITCGVEIEKTKLDDDILKQYIFDGVKAEILLSSADYVASMIKDEYNIEEIDYEIPGSLDGWDMSEQTKLFELIGGVKEAIGVELSKSCIMFPNKSVSGLYFPIK